MQYMNAILKCIVIASGNVSNHNLFVAKNPIKTYKRGHTVLLKQGSGEYNRLYVRTMKFPSRNPPTPEGVHNISMWRPNLFSLQTQTCNNLTGIHQGP